PSKISTSSPAQPSGHDNDQAEKNRAQPTRPDDSRRCKDVSAAPPRSVTKQRFLLSRKARRRLRMCRPAADTAAATTSAPDWRPAFASPLSSLLPVVLLLRRSQ